MNWFKDYPAALKRRISSGTIIDQKYWKYIKELNSFSDERLDSVALICDDKKLTYREMFLTWERFAEIFTALNITEAKKSRIGMVSSMSFDCINMIYAANMTGTSVSLIHPLYMRDIEHLTTFVKKEHITDIVLASDLITPGELRTIIDAKKTLKIKNVIVYQYSGMQDAPGINSKNRKNHGYVELKKVQGARFLDDLKNEYMGTPIHYGSDDPKEGAIVFHTSGTTSGIHKPVPLSDSAFNESAARILRDKRFSNLKNMVTLMMMEPIAAYSACDQMHVPLSFGGTICMLSSRPDNPETLGKLVKNKVSVIFGVGMMMDMLSRLPFKPDFSYVEMFIMGGSYVSTDVKQRCRECLKQFGSSGEVYVGYGLTEAGGAVLLSEEGSTDDSLGMVLPGVKIKILDEDENKYYDLDEGPRTGALCISTKSLSSGKLDNTTFFELDDVDGEKYLNTYDLVDVNENGNIRVIGRMNKFFVNNEGVRFDAGLIETAVSGEPGIVDCGIVPSYNKLIHDTAPVLYVKTTKEGDEAVKIVKDALYSVFVQDGKIIDTNLPSQAVITDNLPYTHTGKVDIHEIQRGKYEGITLKINPIRKRDRLVDVELTEPQGPMRFRDGGIPDELEKDIELYKKGGITGRMRRPPMHGMGPGGGPGMPGMPSMPGMASMSGMANLSGMLNPDMLVELIKNGVIEPEMIGRMLARVLLSENGTQKKGKKKHRRRNPYRGC